MAERPARFRDVFAVGEFRVLWLAQAFSVAGDQLAAVGLAVRVYDRTGSPAWTALTYAMTFLPDLAGGALLAGLADRFPRRRVMVTADLVRAALVGVMAIPGQPILSLIALVIGVQLLSAPFLAARSAMLPQVLSGDLFVASVAITRMTVQFGQLIGFGAGAAVVACLGTSTALLVDAGTFVVSAALVLLGARPHAPSAAPSDQPRGWWAGIRAGFGLVAADRRLRSLVGLACVCGAFVVPEGLAAPYAAQIHAGTQAVGWLMAASPGGMVVGMLVLQRLPAPVRLRLLGPLAAASCVALLPTGIGPPLAGALALWFTSGLASAYNMVTNAAFIQAVPDHSRAQAIGLAQAALRVAQGIGIVGAGLLAQVLEPGAVITVIAAAGVPLALAMAAAWSRAADPASASRA